MEVTIAGGTDDDKRDPILPQHRDDLIKSGLRPEIITASGIYSESNPDRVKELLGDYLSPKTARAMGPCLAFPYLDVDGKPTTWLPAEAKQGAIPRPFIRLKPDNATWRGDLSRGQSSGILSVHHLHQVQMANAVALRAGQ